MRSDLGRTRKITYTAIMIALAVSLRIMKHMLFSGFQFISFPAVFTIASGILFGPTMGLSVGIASYLLSDILLGLPGYWTFVNALLMGAFGVLGGLVFRRVNINFSKIAMGIAVYIMVFAFDILSSGLLYMIIGWPPTVAFTWGIIGLFLPVPIAGGFVFAVGPITETTTTVVVVAIVAILLKSGIGRRAVPSVSTLSEEKRLGE